MIGVRSGSALIVVDGLHGFGRPAEGLRPVGQSVLTCRTFAVAAHLLKGGLANVDHRLSAKMIGADLGIGEHHGSSLKQGSGGQTALSTKRDRRRPSCSRSASGNR